MQNSIDVSHDFSESLSHPLHTFVIIIFSTECELIVNNINADTAVSEQRVNHTLPEMPLPTDLNRFPTQQICT